MTLAQIGKSFYQIDGEYLKSKPKSTSKLVFARLTRVINIHYCVQQISQAFPSIFTYIRTSWKREREWINCNMPTEIYFICMMECLLFGCISTAHTHHKWLTWISAYERPISSHTQFHRTSFCVVNSLYLSLERISRYRDVFLSRRVCDRHSTHLIE